ncbi:MAG: dihydrolipoamide acetyltransferase family protein [Candidatus Neomarinimicrobiota bacterium]
MRYIFKFPDIGEGITEGRIIKWYVKKGQSINSGEPIVNMETDKVVTDIPSPKNGTIITLFGQEGELINVDDPLIELEIEGVSGVEAQEIVKEQPKIATEEPVDEKGFGVVGTIDVAGDSALLPSTDEGLEDIKISKQDIPKKILATPVARALARDLGIDINSVSGSGPVGRVMKEDIYKYKKQVHISVAEKEATDINQVEYEDLSQIRKTIAQNMVISKQSAPHMTVIDEVEISELIKIRNQYKDQFKENGTKLSFLAFFMKATANALKKHSALNSELDSENDRLVLKKYYNIGIAVDTDEGLVVPVIKNVDKISFLELSLKIDDIIQRARERKLTLDDFKDGTFTITNYGSIGGTYGVPVINYPQAAILGIGRFLKTPIVKDEEIDIGNILPLSMSVDHRIVDGGEAVRFLNQVMAYLHDPVSLLLS